MLMRQEAVSAQQRLSVRPADDGWPVTASHWQDVFQKDAALEASCSLRVLQAQARRTISARLEAHDILKEEVPRLSPSNRCKAPYPAWVRKVSQSSSPLVAVRIPGITDSPAVLFIAQTRRLQPWGLLLQHAPGVDHAQFILPPKISPASIRPLQDFWHLTEQEDAATQVYAAKIALRPDDLGQAFLVSILDIDEIFIIVAKKKKSKLQIADASDSDEEAIIAWEKTLASDSDGTLLSSEDDSREEGNQGQDPDHNRMTQGQAPSSGEEAPSLRTLKAAPKHTHTVRTNEYYTLTDNRNYPDCRLAFHEQWLRGTGGMAKAGARQASKTLSPAVHGETREEPKLSYLILRAWALWRMQQSPEWLQAKSERQLFYDAEVRKIKIRLASLQHPLHDKVRERLHAWAPEVLL